MNLLQAMATVNFWLPFVPMVFAEEELAEAVPTEEEA